jgi:hypothetical protein
MCPGRSDERARGGGCAMVALMGAVALSGCSGASSIIDSAPSIGSRFANLFSSAKPGVTQPASPTPSAPEVECPGVDIRTGASTLEVAAKPDQPTAGDLRYQLSFGQTARECLVQAGTMSIKVGVQGRVILGPMGAPGQINVPLRYAVVREGPQPKTVVTKFKRVAVAVPADQTHVQFIDVEEGLSFPLPPKSELEAYVVYVGFDEIADRNEKKPAKSGKKLAPRPQ